MTHIPQFSTSESFFIVPNGRYIGKTSLWKVQNIWFITLLGLYSALIAKIIESDLGLFFGFGKTE